MNADEGRSRLYELLGDLPPGNLPIRSTCIGEEPYGSGVLEKLVLDLNGVETVPAYLVRPADAASPCPAVLYNHAHGGDFELGKDEFIRGRSALQSPPWAEEVLRLGCVGLCIDTWAFGERLGRTQSEIFKEMLWHGQVLWGMMVYDNLRAMDFLAGRDDVDAERIATLGISMGSTMAWWTAALDTRIKVCIDLCCLTDFDALIETKHLNGHGFYYFVPDLLRHFSAGDINALIAPRHHLGLAGNHDRLTPPAGLDRIDTQLKRVYHECGAPDAWKLLRYECGHMETAEMRAEAVTYLKSFL